MELLEVSEKFILQLLTGSNKETDMLLSVEGLSKNFAGIRATNNLSFHVSQGEILGLIGPNGAGKTTIFNLISGVYKPTTGRIIFNSRKINGLKPHVIAAAGISRTFQLTKIYNQVSVLQHVIMGQHCRTGTFLWGAISRNKAARREEADALKKALNLLKEFDLLSIKDKNTDNIYNVQQRRLMIATALASDPLLLLLDEPTAGMSNEETEQTVEMIHNVKDKGVAIIIIEHNMKVAMEISDRIIALNYGEKLAEGSPAEVANNKLVIDAYLGEE
jgi:branched-chain amino acid transport system ATP-binding protein